MTIKKPTTEERERYRKWRESDVGKAAIRQIEEEQQQEDEKLNEDTAMLLDDSRWEEYKEKHPEEMAEIEEELEAQEPSDGE